MPRKLRSLGLRTGRALGSLSSRERGRKRLMPKRYKRPRALGAISERELKKLGRAGSIGKFARAMVRKPRATSVAQKAERLAALKSRYKRKRQIVKKLAKRKARRARSAVRRAVK